MNTLESLLATIIVPGTACFLIPFYILEAAGISLGQPFGIRQFVAILIAALGIGMVIWVSVAFVRIGKGTPVPLHPPKRFVASGLYCYVRNPMYVGALMILLAEALYFSSVWIFFYAAGLWLAFQAFLVLWEEPQLSRRFGAEYENYLKTVARWIPKLSRATRQPHQV
jgi:protein-S-isoprenylcysteine O-methyltransferase Ste14